MLSIKISTSFKIVFVFSYFYFCLPWVCTAALGLGLLASCAAQASHSGGLSYCRAWVLGAWASVGAVRWLRYPLAR